MDFAKQKTEGESGINGYRSLYSERYPLFCGRGGEASDVFLCRTLTQSPTVPALSRREPWFERSLCAVRIRIICGYRMLFTGGETDYTEQTDNCPWQLSAGISNKLQIRNNVTKCPTPSLQIIAHSECYRFVREYHLFYLHLHTYTFEFHTTDKPRQQILLTGQFH